jgi:hypothetical protein
VRRGASPAAGHARVSQDGQSKELCQLYAIHALSTQCDSLDWRLIRAPARWSCRGCCYCVLTMPRGRRNTESMDSVVDRIQAEVTQLIEENKNLKKELARLQSGAANGVDRRVLAGLQRRLQTALGPTQTSGGRTRATRRKITDPQVLEKRRAALAKARSALAEKRAAAQP